MTQNRIHDSRRARIAFALSACALAGTLFGCAPHPAVLATIGSRTITVDDYKDIANRAQFQYRVPPDSAKILLLEDLVRRALLLEQAQKSGLVSDSAVADYRRHIETEVLNGSLMERVIPRTIPVSKSEARELYDWRTSEAKIQLIYAVDRRIVDAALAALATGEPFSQVADRFNLAGMLPPEGQLDFLAPGSLTGPLDDVLRDGKVGEVLPPVRAPGEGWFIPKVLARRPHPQEAFASVEPQLLDLLRQRKRRVLSARAYENLRDEYRVTIENDGPNVLFDRYNNVPSGIPADSNYAPPPPTAEEERRVLARYDGGPGMSGVYTLREAISDLQTETGEKPNPSMLPAFRQWMEGKVVQHVAVIEAKRRHLHEEPENARRIRENVENYILNTIYDAEVIKKAEATDQDMRAAFELHVQNLMRVESATLQTMVLPDSQAAERMAERARTAPTLRSTILIASPGLQVQEQVVRFPNDDPVWKDMEPELRQMPEGSVGAPRAVGDRWLVFQLVSKHLFEPTLESLPRDTQDAVHAEALRIARERRLDELTNSVRKSFPVQEHRERLRSIPWPGTNLMLPPGLRS